MFPDIGTNESMVTRYLYINVRSLYSTRNSRWNDRTRKIDTTNNSFTLAFTLSFLDVWQDYLFSIAKEILDKKHFKQKSIAQYVKPEPNHSYKNHCF